MNGMLSPEYVRKCIFRHVLPVKTDQPALSDDQGPVVQN